MSGFHPGLAQLLLGALVLLQSCLQLPGAQPPRTGGKAGDATRLEFGARQSQIESPLDCKEIQPVPP